MGFSLQRGVSKATGKITLDRAARKGAIEVTIDATSVKTIDPKLDTHIQSEDFFNVAKYPSITFKSSELSFDGDRVIGVDGELTMLGITRPVKLKRQFRLRRSPTHEEGLVRRVSDDDDQALGLGNEIRHPQGAWRRRQDHDPGGGLPRIATMPDLRQDRIHSVSIGAAVRKQFAPAI